MTRRFIEPYASLEKRARMHLALVGIDETERRNREQAADFVRARELTDRLDWSAKLWVALLLGVIGLAVSGLLMWVFPNG